MAQSAEHLDGSFNGKEQAIAISLGPAADDSRVCDLLPPPCLHDGHTPPADDETMAETCPWCALLLAGRLASLILVGGREPGRASEREGGVVRGASDISLGGYALTV